MDIAAGCTLCNDWCSFRTLASTFAMHGCAMCRQCNVAGARYSTKPWNCDDGAAGWLSSWFLKRHDRFLGKYR
jgi:hypothetical protein